LDLNSIIYDERLTKESILKFISELDIYSFYIGKEVLSLKPINSPLRRDNIPSFSVFYASKSGKYLFKDFGNGMSGDCFTLVQIMYGLSYNGALERIAVDFGITTSSISPSIKPISKVSIQELSNKERVNLQIKSKRPSSKDKDFWSQFGITPKVLSKYMVKVVDLIFINNNIINPKTNCYAYLEFKDDNPTYKIYQPFSKEYKFMNNNNYSVWEGWTQMPSTGDLLIITSSRKDVMSIVSTTDYPAVALQSESVLPKKQVIEELKSSLRHIYII
jgi:DNA primase (bacterial type)